MQPMVLDAGAAELAGDDEDGGGAIDDEDTTMPLDTVKEKESWLLLGGAEDVDAPTLLAAGEDVAEATLLEVSCDELGTSAADELLSWLEEMPARESLDVPLLTATPDDGGSAELDVSGVEVAPAWLVAGADEDDVPAPPDEEEPPCAELLPVSGHPMHAPYAEPSAAHTCTPCAPPTHAHAFWSPAGHTVEEPEDDDDDPVLSPLEEPVQAEAATSRPTEHTRRERRLRARM